MKTTPKEGSIHSATRANAIAKWSSGFMVQASPYLAGAGALLLAGATVTTLSLTAFPPMGMMFLAGILAASTLASASQAANARWMIARRGAQLAAIREKLATASSLRAAAEQSLDRMRQQYRMVDEKLPAAIAYLDDAARVQYHNQAYARWLGVDDRSIDGHGLDELIGPAVVREIAPRISEAMDGRDVRYERVQLMRDGRTSHVLVQLFPNFAADGTVSGLFVVLTDITRPDEVANEAPAVLASTEKARERLVSALERGEFTLRFQAIEPLAPGSEAIEEVFLRMNEEEDNRLPPGGFVPVAAELGLLHEIDRWVVRHVLDFAGDARGRTPSSFMVSTGLSTLRDPGFAPFVRAQLEAARVGGATLCFELGEEEVLSDPDACRAFIRALEGSGCRFAVSGFGRDPATLSVLGQLGIHFVKIEGSLVLDMLRSKAGHSRVKLVSLAARAAGLRVIAECVESDHARVALGRLGVHYVQGFGVGSPRSSAALAAENERPRCASAEAAA